MTKISKQSLHSSCFGANWIKRKEDQILISILNIERERLVIIRIVDILPKKMDNVYTHNGTFHLIPDRTFQDFISRFPSRKVPKCGLLGPQAQAPFPRNCGWLQMLNDYGTTFPFLLTQCSIPFSQFHDVRIYKQNFITTRNSQFIFTWL